MITAGGKNIRKIMLNLIGAAVLLYTVFFVFGMAKAAFSETDVPNEYQEVTNIQLTRCFMDGVNPYSLDTAVNGDAPGLVYEYGFVYSLITAFLASFIHIDIILLHYIVSFVSMIVAAILGMIIVKDKTETLLPPAAAFLLVICCTWRYGYINAVPDSMAFMFTILALFIETRSTFRHREMAEIVCIAAAFFTKIYMAYLALPLFVYKLIKDRKAARRFFIYGVLTVCIVSAAVTVFCPLYWTYAVYFLHGPWNGTPAQNGGEIAGMAGPAVIDVLTFRNTTEPRSGLGYEVLQLRSLLGMFLCMFAVMFIGAVDHFRKALFKKNDTMLLSFICFIVSIPVMFVLGTNDGAWLSYYLQIQMFPVIVFSLIYLESKCVGKCEKIRFFGWIAVCCVTIVFTVFRVSGRLPYYYMTDEQKQIWRSAYLMLDEYSKEGEIYYSPVLAFHAIRNDRDFYNNGLAGRSMLRLYDEYTQTEWQQKLFPYAGEVMKKRIAYLDTLSEKVRKGDFVLISAIVGDDGTDRVLKADDIKEGPYEPLEHIDLPVSRVNYRVDLWRKKTAP